MANRKTVLAVLTGLLVGALMGAGVIQYAELTADVLMARTDYHYRSARYNSQQESDPALLRNDGMTGVRGTEPKTATLRGAASAKESARSCNRIGDMTARAKCLNKVIDSLE
jgi:hypothetical protein